MARKKGENLFLWRLVLIPAFLFYLRLFECFDFIMNLGSVNFVEYARNFLILGAAALGLILVIAASPSRRLLLSVGFVLILLPAWLDTGFHMGPAGMAVDEIQNADALSLAFAASGCLWGTLMVRGPKGREWEKAILFLVLIARSAGLIMWTEINAVWYTDAMVFALSVCLGSLSDSVYRTPCLGNLFVPAVSGGWILLVGWLKAIDVSIAMYIVIALSLVLITYFLCTKPSRKMYLGFILTLFGACAAAAQYFLIGLEIL
ncbi:MAG: hypothetical protein IJC48_04205 [Clostridia bacterium]|nr:hypothetical protein [Clostridia bacterium]